MPIMIQCPNCKKLLGADKKECRSKTGKGCGKPIPHRQKTYYIQWLDPNRRTKQRKIGASKKAAQNELNKIIVEITEGRYIDRKTKPTMTIKEFVEQHYRPWCQTNNKGYEASKKYWINTIVDEWGSLKLDEFSYEHLTRFQWQMKKAKTLVKFNRVHATLSHMFNKAVREWKVVDQSPIAGTSDLKFKEIPRTRFLDTAEVRALIDACQPHLRPIVETAVYTGMRRGEVLGLRLGTHVDLDRRMISLKAEETKGGKDRHIPVNDTLFEILSVVAEGKEPGDFMFARNDGTPYLEVKRSYKAALKAAKIEDATFHSLRDTYASHLAMNRVDLYTIGELLGHSDYRQTQKYAHLSNGHRERAVKVLDGLFDEEQGENAEAAGSA